MASTEELVNTFLNTGGLTIFEQKTITRPANTTAYAQYDIIAGVDASYLFFTKASLQGGYITYAKLTTTDTGWSTDDVFRVHIIKGSSIATYTDNAALAISAAEAKSNYLGYIEMTLETIGGIELALNSDTLRKPFYASALAGGFVTIIQYYSASARTPSANSTAWSLELGFEQNVDGMSSNATPFGLNDQV